MGLLTLLDSMASNHTQDAIKPKSGGQWYDIKYEAEWVRDHNDEWKRRVVAKDEWLDAWLIAEDDF